MAARAALKRKFTKGPKKPDALNNQKLLMEEKKKEEEQQKQNRPKVERKWATISDKVDKKAMDAIVVNKDDNDAHIVNLEAEMEKYLGGDDDKLDGFYESDDDIEFDSIGTGSAAADTG